MCALLLRSLKAQSRLQSGGYGVGEREGHNRKHIESRDPVFNTIQRHRKKENGEVLNIHGNKYSNR